METVSASPSMVALNNVRKVFGLCLVFGSFQHMVPRFIGSTTSEPEISQCSYQVGISSGKEVWRSVDCQQDVRKMPADKGDACSVYPSSISFPFQESQERSSSVRRCALHVKCFQKLRRPALGENNAGTWAPPLSTDGQLLLGNLK